MNIAALNPFATAKEKATSDVTRLEDGLATRILDLEALDSKIAVLQSELSAAIEAGRNTDALEASIAQCTMTSQGKAVAVRAASDALTRARKRLNDLEYAQAVEEARFGLEARQLAIAKTEKEFSKLVLQLADVARAHARAAEEEEAILSKLRKFGEAGAATARNLETISESTLAEGWANGGDAVQTLLTLSVRASDAPALDRLFP